MATPTIPGEGAATAAAAAAAIAIATSGAAANPVPSPRARVCIVLGGGGFIGGHLAARLAAQGHTVTAVDIKAHEFRPDLHVVIADLRDYSAALAAIPDDADEVYQLAADMGGATYINAGTFDADVMSNSVLINVNVARACVVRRVKRVFFASSACVYPEHNQMDPSNPMCAEDSVYPAHPDTEYGWEKLFAERLYTAFTRQHGLVARIARFHNVYGPFGTWCGGKEKAPAALCRKVAAAIAAGGAPIDVIGDGEQTRSFLFIDDCLDGVQALMASDCAEPLNIGSEEMVTINGLARAVMAVAGAEIPLHHISGPQGVRGRNSDNRLVEATLGWRPRVSLAAGLAPTYAWIADEMKRAAAAPLNA